MSVSELLQRVAQVKAQSNRQFEAGELAAACSGYERGRRILQLVPSQLSAEEEASLHSLQLALLLNGAACSQRTDSFGEALTLSDAAVALEANAPKAHFRRGEALEALGRLAEAEASFEVVLQLQPTNKQAHERLRALHARVREAAPSKAEESVLRALRLV